jgi:glutaminyl-peptide cyclotransferase
MVLLDMVGDADARFVRETRSVASAEWLVDLVWAHGRATGPADRFTDRACSVYDDHMPFVERGVAVVDVIDFGRGDACRFPPYWHTADDTLDKLSPAALGHVGATVWALLEDDALAAALAPEE